MDGTPREAEEQGLKVRPARPNPLDSSPATYPGPV